MIPELNRVLDPGYLAAITDAPIERVRAMRAECADLENGSSFVRRVAQGRLDLLAEETRRRADGDGGSLKGLVDGLVDTLSDGVRATGSGRADRSLEPPAAVVDSLTEVLDSRVAPSALTSAAEMSNDELGATLVALGDFEAELSAARRGLHGTIDSLNNELARRIAAGDSPTAPA